MLKKMHQTIITQKFKNKLLNELNKEIFIIYGHFIHNRWIIFHAYQTEIIYDKFIKYFYQRYLFYMMGNTQYY